MSAVMHRPGPGARRLAELALVVVAWAVELLLWEGSQATRWGVELPWVVVPLASAIALSTLLLRWRWPVAVFVVQVLYAVLSEILVPEYYPFLGVLIALYAVARTSSAPVAAAAGVTALIPYVVGAANFFGSLSADPGGLMLFILLWALLLFLVWGMGRLTWLADRRARREQTRLAAEASAAAVRDDRIRLARELHDTVTHAVSGMLLQAAGARAVIADPHSEVGQALQAIEDLGVNAMGELHRLLGVLRTADPADTVADKHRGPQDVPGLVELIRAAGVDVTLETSGEAVDAEPAAALAIYRIVQESLTNVMKHAGVGAHVEVQLQWRPGCCEVTVTDRVATDQAPTTQFGGAGTGLSGIEDRVAQLGGMARSERLDNGFRIFAAIPTRPSNAEDAELVPRRRPNSARRAGGIP